MHSDALRAANPSSTSRISKIPIISFMVNNRTKNPRLGFTSTSFSCSKNFKALIKGVRLTPKSLASFSWGIFLPGNKDRSSIICLTTWYIF